MVFLNIERFDVVSVKDRAAKGLKFVVLTANHLHSINSLVIAPLVPNRQAAAPIRKMHPVLQFDGEPHLLLVNELANVPRNLVAARLGSVNQHHAEITSALDFLFQGY